MLRNPRPLVHELGSISFETVRKILYKLYVHNHETPEGFIFGRDVLLLSIVIGDDRHRKTKPFTEMLQSLDVFEGAGAYYVVIDTSLDLPTLHSGAHLEDGLDTSITIAALVREQEPLEKELSREDWLEIEKNARLEYAYRAKRGLAIERKKKLLDDAWKSGYTAMKERNDVHEGYIRHLSWLVNRFFLLKEASSLSRIFIISMNSTNCGSLVQPS